jgi:hypothetical protein
VDSVSAPECKRAHRNPEVCIKGIIYKYIYNVTERRSDDERLRASADGVHDDAERSEDDIRGSAIQ